MLEQISSVFLEEANELLDNLEEQLLTLEENPTDSETVSAVFRAMHTIKGSSAMFGFNAISEFTHEAESAMDQVRNGIVPVSNELIDLLLKARDHIRFMLDAGQEITPEITQTSQTLILAFKTYVARNGGTVSEDAANLTGNSSQNQNPAAKTKEQDSTYRIKFRPSKKILQNGTRPELLVKELSEMGNATVVSFYDSLPELSKLNAEECYFSWDIILTTQKTENDIKDVFIFLDNESSFTVEKIELNPEENHRIGEILIDRNDISKNQIDSVMQEHKQLGQILVEKQLVSNQQIKSALAEQQHFKAMNGETPVSGSSSSQSSIRVSSEKLDSLVDLIGELVTFNARLEQLAIEKDLPVLKNLSEQSSRLAVSLRDTSLEIRMLPIGTLFTRFRRTVRDLAEQLGKQIDLVIEGAETELDKTVVEKLNDPLIHLIRNSVDHGIELPVERIANKKAPKGTVTLSAKHQTGAVVITVSDDGKGLDKDAIRKKAIEKKLILEDEKISESEIFHFIFQPGFSTAKQVSNVSGRGVGLDVVKKDVLSLGGSISIESEPNKGTSFILKIPLTLAIIDGMLTQVGNTKYIIPVNTISECLFFEQAGKKNETLFPHTLVHGKDVPCIDLRKFFKIPESYLQKKEVVTINSQEGQVGIIVDKILGSHQTVIKPLGKLYQNCLGISNSTILGDGSVALILDVYKLADLVNSKEAGKK
ncbi:chemotaxis protein CheA [Treponema berlinense]|uniref:chemotaxis protein CheA n=1 Tax=Treponema berlinense TaxID=225004 RepID=UPI003FD86CFD